MNIGQIRLLFNVDLNASPIRQLYMVNLDCPIRHASKSTQHIVSIWTISKEIQTFVKRAYWCSHLYESRDSVFPLCCFFYCLKRRIDIKKQEKTEESGRIKKKQLKKRKILEKEKKKVEEEKKNKRQEETRRNKKETRRNKKKQENTRQKREETSRSKKDQEETRKKKKMK